MIPDGAFQGLDAAKSRIQASKDAAGSKESQNFSQAICHNHHILTIPFKFHKMGTPFNPGQVQMTLKKFLDSLQGKANRLRSLVADLEKEYHPADVKKMLFLNIY